MKPPIGSLEALLGRLRDLDWTVPKLAHEDCRQLFGRLTDPALLLSSLATVEPDDVERNRSTEKTTHFKWFLAADEDRRFEVWLHDYKPAGLRRTGHATVLHNHRYPFTSILLRGGFTSNTFDRDEALSAAPRPTRRTRLGAGDSFVVHPDEIHALDEIDDGTLTLVVQGRPVASFSQVFEAGTVTVHRDLPSQFCRLVAETRTMPAFMRQ